MEKICVNCELVVKEKLRKGLCRSCFNIQKSVKAEQQKWKWIGNKDPNKFNKD